MTSRHNLLCKPMTTRVMHARYPICARTGTVNPAENLAQIDWMHSRHSQSFLTECTAGHVDNGKLSELALGPQWAIPVCPCQKQISRHISRTMCRKMNNKSFRRKLSLNELQTFAICQPVLEPAQAFVWTSTAVQCSVEASEGLV